MDGRAEEARVLIPIPERFRAIQEVEEWIERARRAQAAVDDIVGRAERASSDKAAASPGRAPQLGRHAASAQLHDEYGNVLFTAPLAQPIELSALNPGDSVTVTFQVSL